MGAFGGLAEEGQDPNYWVYRSPCWRPDCVAGKGVDCGEAERGGGGLEEGASVEVVGVFPSRTLLGLPGPDPSPKSSALAPL